MAFKVINRELRRWLSMQEHLLPKHGNLSLDPLNSAVTMSLPVTLMLACRIGRLVGAH